MNIYHNTFVMAEGSRQADMATFASSGAKYPRRVFNNVYLHLTRLPAYTGPDPAGDAIEDGNLFWAPGIEAKAAGALFQRFRASEKFAQSKKIHPPGSSTNSLVADPKFRGAGDYRLQEGSPAVDAGVALPEDWPDPLRKEDRGKPDVGALPLGVEPFRVGR